MLSSSVRLQAGGHLPPDSDPAQHDVPASQGPPQHHPQQVLSQVSVQQAHHYM